MTGRATTRIGGPPAPPTTLDRRIADLEERIARASIHFRNAQAFIARGWERDAAVEIRLGAIELEGKL